MCALTYNPLHCIDCNLEIKPESLVLGNTLVDAIAYWVSMYDAIYRLWLTSGEYEGWAKDQLADIRSPVNKIGLDLRKELNEVLQCNYWYFQDQGVERFEAIKECPNCQGPLKEYTNSIFRQMICEQCSIVTVGE